MNWRSLKGRERPFVSVQVSNACQGDVLGIRGGNTRSFGLVVIPIQASYPDTMVRYGSWQLAGCRVFFLMCDRRAEKIPNSSRPVVRLSEIGI